MRGRYNENMYAKLSLGNPQLAPDEGCTGRLAMPIFGQNRIRTTKTSVIRKKVMNTRKFRRCKIFGRQLFFFLAVLLLTAGLVVTQAPTPAHALPKGEDPTDTEPIVIDDQQYTPPAGGFSWAMEKRYGLDTDRDGMIDSHWNPTSMTYDPAYIYPYSWKISINGCQTGNDYTEWGKRPLDPLAEFHYEYQWKLDNTILTTGNCRPTLTLKDKEPHEFRLTVTKLIDGSTTEFPLQSIQVKDYLIVVIGDSYGSGQGNPDIEQTVETAFPAPGWIMKSPARWQDERCQRSANSAASLAAIALEASDPHSSVTFISFACTGATIYTDSYDWEMTFEGIKWNNRGSGLLGPHRGEVTDVPFHDWEHYIKPQMVQVQEALDASNGQTDYRSIDALIISAGGNDMKFGPVLMTCIEAPNCWFNDWFKLKLNPITDTIAYTLYDTVTRAVGLWAGDDPPAKTIPDGYDQLGVAINALYPKPKHVYVTQYPDPTINDRGVANEASETSEHHCRMLDDVFWPDPYPVMTDAEAKTASHHAQTLLNTAIRDSVTRLAVRYSRIHWQFVDGLSVYDVDTDQAVAGKPGLFKGGPNGGRGHGYCASDNWIRRADESELLQGPVNNRAGNMGTMHPNLSGQQAVKSRILRYMMPDLTGHADPTPVFSFNHQTEDGLISKPGLNGWYTAGCNNMGQCYPRVGGHAVALSSEIPLVGASISVNDTGGCSVPGVTCSAALNPNDSYQAVYYVKITKTGAYRFHFNAKDEYGRVSFMQQEIKLDLDNPVLARPVGPFQVDQGSSVVLSARIATDATGAPLHDDMLVDYDWDLDNDGDFEETEEQPTFKATNITGPANIPIQVKVTDRAGRTDIAQSEIQVLYVGPAVVINGLPESSPEGTEINLGSTVHSDLSGPYTYAWTVQKNGEFYASGVDESLDFIPNDDGLYEVSLEVSKNGDSVGTAGATIEVTNVAPVLLNPSSSPAEINEGESITVSGGILDPGTEDSLTLEIYWGDGSALEQKNLAAGTSSYSVSHIYADDNPSGTASDRYNFAMRIIDKDNDRNGYVGEVTVNNVAPSLNISAPVNGALNTVNTRVNLSAALTDPSSLDTLTYSITWGDGSSEEPQALAAGTSLISASHIYTAVGVYTIKVTGTDDDLGSKTESVMAVVYDPSSGFVTGGGWIDSPAGAFQADVSLVGKANFGFVSKYLKGATVPSGHTAFEFHVAGLSFSSQSYEWLVVNQAGKNAQFKGAGLIGGEADPNGNAYKFMLWAGDGTPDTFRIRIWWEDADGEYDVYDNGTDQPIGGGSIVVHTKK
jgi:hypothetical protein